jgi:hypothetical protein
LAEQVAYGLKRCLRLLGVKGRMKFGAYEAMYATRPVGWPLSVVQLIIRDGWEGDSREVCHRGVINDGVPDPTTKG